jgi:hypothetical protein
MRRRMEARNGQGAAMSDKQKVYGEGNHEGTRQYNSAATGKFVRSGRVDEAARAAAPHSAREAKHMRGSEQAALLCAKDRPPPAKVRKVADYD